MILMTGAVDAIYRFSGRAIVGSVEACLFALSNHETRYFSERGQINLHRLVEPAMRRRIAEGLTERRIPIVAAWNDGEEGLLDVAEVHKLDDPGLVRYAEFASRNQGLPLDALMSAYRERRSATGW